MIIAGSICMGISLFVSCMNFCLSFIRPLFYLRRRAEYRFVSGLPLFGTIFLLLSVILLPWNLYLGCLVIAAVVLDTAGPPWFIAVGAGKHYANRKMIEKNKSFTLAQSES